ncbi:MAG: HEAT repeat domain-containing protein [Armatimonadota bacterium]
MNLEEYVRYYLNEMHNGDAENAYFSLIEADASIVPMLQDAYTQEINPELRAQLVHIISQFRLTASIPFFASGLQDPEPAVWKACLDGLVMLACPQSIQIMEDALKSEHSTSEFREWVQEAIDQIKEPNK